MITPHKIRRRDDGLEVTWEEDAAPIRLAAKALRLACPCASCHDEMTGAPLLAPERIPETIAPQAVSLVGGYGIRISWSDGHDTGIYTFRALAEMAEAASTMPGSADA